MQRLDGVNKESREMGDNTKQVSQRIITLETGSHIMVEMF